MITRLVLLMTVSVLLQACGSAHVKPGGMSSELQRYTNAYIAEIKVRSKEQNGNSLDMNKKMELYAKSKIDQVITTKKYRLIDDPGANNQQALAFKLNISVVYGSRAARYFAGFGAGKGTVNSQLEVVDSLSNEVIYSSSAASVLSVGAFGGSMESVLKENIDKLIAAYPKS